LYGVTNVSEERIVSIFRVEVKTSVYTSTARENLKFHELIGFTGPEQTHYPGGREYIIKLVRKECVQTDVTGQKRIRSFITVSSFFIFWRS
jgi:hypothetical protein